MSFLHAILFWWGLPLLAAPILIHLINLLRHRRVQWAAMEFLLASQKRNRNWIILKQLLLLLLRVAVVAALVAMVAQPLLRKSAAGILGGTKTHHVVLLDDSYSMADRWTDSSAFDEARRVVEKLAGRATQQDTPQSFTLLRFSRAARGKGAQYDQLTATVDADFPARVARQLRGINVSEYAVGPQPALEAVEQLPAAKGDEDRIVYLVSDLRAREWNEPTALRKVLDRIERSGAQLHLIHCVDAGRPNLAITSLRAGGGTRAAGVPLVMELAVHNYGLAPASDVSVSLAEDGAQRPPVVFEDVPPGKTVTRQFQVQFTAAGEHRVEAALSSDHLATDNRRVAVLDVPLAAPALVVDGDPQARDAFFVSAVLAPGGKVSTGVKPVVEGPRFLDNHPFDSYAAIYLLNVDRLSAPAVTALEGYVRAGGGLAVFVGELTRGDFMNRELYREGRGLFPAPLGFPTELLVDRGEKTPDLNVTNHPIFAIFAGQRNSFLATVNVERYFTVERNWSPPADSTVRVIARLRNGAPLAIEQKFGSGRVIAVLTKASPIDTGRGRWNNWGSDNPSYVVTLLQMQAYLSAARSIDAVRLVGAPLEVRFPDGQFQPDVRFLLPGDGGREALTVPSTVSGKERVAVLADVERGGVYEAQLTAPDGTIRARRFAVNVADEEGNLKTFDLAQLTGRLPGLKFEYAQAREFDYQERQQAGINLGPALLYLLVALLLGEQGLAYLFSYHPPAKRGAR